MNAAPAPFACITTSWDDGHPLDHRLADMLVRRGLTGTFYVPRTCGTPTMSEADVRSLASAGFEIGAHTLSHAFLDTVDDATAAAEISGSRSWVQDVTGRPCPMFCPPGGRHGERDVRLIRAAGFTAFRTVELLSLDAPRQLGDGLSVMPTTLQAHPHRAAVYARNALKRLSAGNLWRYVVHGSGSDWRAAAASLLARVVARGGVFHLWGHSWELEASGQWARLDEVLELMGQYARVVPCVTNARLCDLALARDAAGTTAATVLT
ncbi:MAG TPA: polysaccharide deacetylase family protein [Tepidisphaeraceae bacterium]|nr:polysaccharide deacetylase family protein [Tepidisphaeraceae bacterium]